MVRCVKLADVIDLEAQLVLDREQEGSRLHARDRAIYLGLSPDAGDQALADGPLLTQWLDALRSRYLAPRLGQRVALGQRLLSYLLVVLGLGSGWGTAELLLRFGQGTAPVNVGGYLAVVVFGQLLVVAVLLASLALRGLLSSVTAGRDVARLLRYLAGKLEPTLRSARLGDDAERLHAAYLRARTRVDLYGDLERASLLLLGQWFGVAFNLGLLACCGQLILFSDLAFGWSTSVASLNADLVHDLCHALAVPFGWLLPEAVPSRELIEHTQYFRLDGRFAGAAEGSKGDARLAQQWWPFLVACTVTYGLLPRLLLWVGFRQQRARAERQVPLDTPDVQRVLRRLRTPELSTQASSLTPQAAEPAQPMGELAPAQLGQTHLVLYRDLPTAPEYLTPLLRAQLSAEVVAVHRAGGLDARADATLCQQLGEAGLPVTVATEAWEAPDAGLRRFLAEVRKALGPRTTIRVALVGEASDAGFAPARDAHVRIYRDRLTLLQDPYLIAEVLQPVAAVTDTEVPA